MFMRSVPAAALLAATFVLQSASAAVITYTNEATFDSAVGAGLLVEDFNTDSGSGSPLTVGSGGLLTSIESDADNIFVFENTHTATTGIGVADTGDGDWTMTFNFSQAVESFGFSFNDWPEASSGTLTFQTSAGETGTLLSSGPLPNETVLFLGMTTNIGFTDITLTAVGASNDGSQIDNVKFNAASVPAPAGGALLLLGLATMAGRKRKA